ncbi:M56 family metallopeptidase [Mycolicibacterium mucogenicum]|uniref:M56 family metallopeptidase n=1 Tax=Mycolicibacterium mucogenicum TaxID=56689 RepID=UPI00076AB4A7|nr:M56 family metallopeptidase [Mycolicibacterium mucogenicum]
MSIAVCLLAYSALLLVAGPPVLRRLAVAGRAPALAAAAWLTVIVSVLLSWMAALVVAAVGAARSWDGADVLLASCVAWFCQAVGGEVGGASSAVVMVAVLVAGAVGVVGAVRIVAALRGMRRRADEHANDVRLVGRCVEGADVVVVDESRPAAYCVAGRRSAIVITSAALAALDERERAAVLAHERAHLAGHHPTVLMWVRCVASVFPGLTLMTEGAQQISRLLEMCADDAAARRHGGAALLSGLMTLCGVAPAEALGAADVAVLARAERLVGAGDVVRAPVRAVCAGVLVLVGSAPLIIVTLAASGLFLCSI